MHFDVPASPASTMGAVLGEMMLQENNEVLFRHGLFNAVGNAILLLLLVLLYCVWKLLEDFRSPMLWALLVSLALRDVKVALVRFWTKKLERHTLLGLGLAPLGVCWRAMKAAMTRVNAVMGLKADGGGGGHEPSSSEDGKGDDARGISSPLFRVRDGDGDASAAATTPRSPSRFAAAPPAAATQLTAPVDRAQLTQLTQLTAPSSSSASTFHFRWLVVVGLALEGWSLLSRDWVLTRSIAALAAVAALAAAATVALVAFTNWYLFTREGAYAGQSSRGRRGCHSLVCVYSTLRDSCTVLEASFHLRLTRALIRRRESWRGAK